MLRLQTERHRNLLGQDERPPVPVAPRNLSGAAQELNRWRFNGVFVEFVEWVWFFSFHLVCIRTDISGREIAHH
jgi:hypothetical protein